MDRRSALLLAAGAGVATLGATLLGPAKGPRPARPDELRAFAAKAIRLAPETALQVGLWARSPGGPWRQGAPVFTNVELDPSAWETSVRRQFREGKLVLAEGWILAEREVALCAAIAEVR